jgi:predicted DNA-binding transcriptional regulator YafY
MIGKGDTLQQRLVLMESLLLWEGRLNNGRLRELFDLSGVRASEWIREFREAHPDWALWDSRTRSYHAVPEAYRRRGNAAGRRQEEAASLSQYLALVGIPHATGDSPSGRALWSAFPDLSVPSPRIFSSIAEAIRTRRALEITYRSMQQPAPHQRVISPHSLIRGGRRWHMRAFCSKNQAFRDYALGRIEQAKLLDMPAERREQDDLAWTTMVPVRLIAHPALTPEQESVIRFEYFNNTAARVDSCRGALVGYFIQDIRAATDTKIQQPPDYQLAVANIEEVRPWLFPG